MSKPGAARGDRSVYIGRRCIGHVRISTASVIAFDAAGKSLGGFPSAKAAQSALTARAAAAKGAGR